MNVYHNKSIQRFEITADSLVAELTYKLQEDTIIFTHTRVPSALEGRGFGSSLVKAGLEYAREEHLKVETLCWFVAGFLKRHPEYHDLLEK